MTIDGSRTEVRAVDARALWQEEFDKAKKRGVEFTSLSGAPLAPLYGPEDARTDFENDLGYPGSFPYTRGVHPTMYRSRLWTMRQFAGFGSARQTNERFKFLLAHGQTGLSTAFDFPTLMGYDSDHAHSLGEVGQVGVAISSLGRQLACSWQLSQEGPIWERCGSSWQPPQPRAANISTGPRSL